MATTWNAIFLGHLATELDPDEDNDPGDVDDMENSSLLVGSTFGSLADPLKDHITRVTANDVDGDPTVLDVDNAVFHDTVTYDIGAGAVTVEVDAVARYFATVTYMDGTTGTVSAMVFQDVDGNLFLAPEQTNNADTAVYEAGPIKSITFDSEDAAYNFGTPGLPIERYDTAFVCFAAGTLIETDKGPVPVEALAPGMRVATLDHGFQPLRWVGRREVTGKGPGAPVRIRAGALGPDLPRRTLLVSANHRMLVRSAIARRVFGAGEVLVPARLLTLLPGVRRVERPRVAYVHFACDRHEVVLAEGAPAETLLLGREAMATLAGPALNQLGRIFPGIVGGWRAPRPARMLAEGPKVRRMTRRHQRNRANLVENKGVGPG